MVHPVGRGGKWAGGVVVGGGGEDALGFPARADSGLTPKVWTGSGGGL